MTNLEAVHNHPKFKLKNRSKFHDDHVSDMVTNFLAVPGQSPEISDYFAIKKSAKKRLVGFAL